MNCAEGHLLLHQYGNQAQTILDRLRDDVDAAPDVLQNTVDGEQYAASVVLHPKQEAYLLP